MRRRIPLAVAMIVTHPAWGQFVISAHSGVIHYTEGQVEVDGQRVPQDVTKGKFVEIKNGQTLMVKDGQAEILLTPGVFLRIAQDSSLRMISDTLADTRIEVVSGSAILEVDELPQDNAITLIFRGADISIHRHGLYRIDSDPARLRVYDGEARVSLTSHPSFTARKGRQILFGESFEAQAFDTKQTDAFYNWSARRDQYIAQANVYAAKSASDTSGGYGNGFALGSGAWAYNPWFGMFTYVPVSGVFSSPFGFAFYSPETIGNLYALGSPYYGGNSNSGVGGIRLGPRTIRRAADGPSVVAGSNSGAGVLGGAGLNGPVSNTAGGGHAAGAGGRH